MGDRVEGGSVISLEVREQNYDLKATIALACGCALMLMKYDLLSSFE